MRVFILAGEPSGDKLGGALMRGLKTLLPDQQIEFQGIGGPEMLGEGLNSLFPMEEIAVMGVVEILKQYGHLKARIRQTAEAVLAMQPDVLITVDTPEFSLRTARLVRAKSDIRTVHYVAPTVWAWRPGRARKMAAHVDHVLALFPFEPPFMEAEGMRCDFVGHPVVTEPQASAAEATAFRAAHGLTDVPVALLLPGSRNSEVSRLLPTFREVVAQIVATHPDLRLVLPTLPHVAATVREAVADWPGAPIVLDPSGMPHQDALTQKRAAFAAADVALAASGTVSLELAAAGTPMVIAYDMSWLSRQIIGRMLRVDTVTLVNLISETRVVPEFINDDCLPGPIAKAVLNVLAHPEAQTEACRLTMERLGQGGDNPGERAARAVLDGIASSGPRH